MKIKWRWLVVLIILILFVAIWLLRPSMQPRIFDILGPRLSKIIVIGAFLGIIVYIFDIISKLCSFVRWVFGSDKDKHNPFRLSTTTPDNILNNDSTSWKDITWIDRGIITTKDLRDNKFLIITGRMKSGKTREAAELLRRALKEQVFPEACLYDISKGSIDMTPETLRVSLLKEIDYGSPPVFYLNQLPKDISVKQLAIYKEYLNAIGKCPRGHFVTTARSDYLDLDPKLNDWITKNKGKCLQIKTLSSEQKGDLIDELVKNKGLNLEKQCKNILIDKSDGTPYHLILAFQRLTDHKTSDITTKLADRIISQSKEEIWISIRNDLTTREPAVSSLIDAIAVFYQAGVNLYHQLIIAYAEQLERKKVKISFPGSMHQRFANAVMLMQHYDISFQNQFKLPDVVVETMPNLITPADACRQLEVFLHPHSKLYYILQLNLWDRLANLRNTALSELAVSYYFNNNLEKANTNLRLVLAEDPSNIKAWYNHGVLLTEFKMPEEAMKAYKQTVKYDPNNAPAWSNLGVLLKELKKPSEAEEAYRQGVKADPKYAPVWCNLGNILQEQGRLKEAEAAYHNALAIDDKYPQIWYGLGGLLDNLGRSKEAENAYIQAVNVDPNHAPAWYNLGVFQDKQGKQEDAEIAYREALKINDKFAKAWHNLGVIMDDQNRLEEAEDAYRKTLAVDDKLAQVWCNLGVILHNKGLIDEAENDYHKAIEIDDRYNKAWYNLGVLLVEQGKVEDAENAYRKTLAIDSKDTKVWYNLGLLLLNQNRIGEAEDAFRQALAVNPQYANAWYSLGLILTNTQHYDEALASLQKAVLLQPEEASYHASLGSVYRRMGKLIDAEKELAEAQRLYKNESLYNRACIAALCGETDNALSLLEEALLNHEVTLEWVRRDPDWEDLRQHQRFIQLTT